MKRLALLTAAAVFFGSAAQATDLKMATLPANLSQAITMATFANIVSAELDDVNIEVAFVQSEDRVEHLIISDDGFGISDTIMDKCLWFGAGDNFGAKRGIGKFGIGLPFACCSQSSNYEVISL